MDRLVVNIILTMSEFNMAIKKKTLQQKKEELMLAKEKLMLEKSKENLISLISKFKGLHFNGFSKVADDIIPPSEAWKKVALIGLIPVTSIIYEVTTYELITWVADYLKSQNIKQNVFISIGGYRYGSRFSWMDVSIDSDLSALANLWLATESQEVLFLDIYSCVVIGITCEEYTYDIYKIVLETKNTEKQIT